MDLLQMKGVKYINLDNGYHPREAHIFLIEFNIRGNDAAMCTLACCIWIIILLLIEYRDVTHVATEPRMVHNY